MTDETPPGFDDDEATVIALRHPISGTPTVIPRELALTESRAYSAYSDWLGGMTWEQVAVKHEYADARAAQYDIKQYLESARSLYNSLTAQQAKSLARARLEALLHAAWDGALKGNPTLIGQAHGLTISLIKLDKLDQLGDDEEGGENSTVVIEGQTEDEYLASIESASKPARKRADRD